MKKFRVWKIGEDGQYVSSNKRYLIVNVDELYAENVFELIKASEKEKGTWDNSDSFEDFKNEII